jgi:hypothetical protein
VQKLEALISTHHRDRETFSCCPNSPEPCL